MDLCNPTAGYDSASAATKVNLKEGQFYNYTLYLQPNLYEVKAGHELALVIYAYEPGKASYSQNYTITLDNASVNAAIPVDESTPVDPELPFTDVAAGSWYYDAVKYVYENKVMNGVEGNQFAPDETLSRAMLVTILYRLDGEPSLDGENLGYPFEDVEEGSWYSDPVYWARLHGIVNGVEGNKFAPNDGLTREQMAAILYRYAQYKKLDVSASADLGTFADGSKTSSWAVDAMKWAVGEKLINGLEGNTLAPQNTSTRAQVATVMMRFMEGIA